MENQKKDEELEKLYGEIQKYCEKKGFVGFSFILCMAKNDGFTATISGWKNLNPIFIMQGMMPNLVKALSSLVDMAQKALTKPPAGEMYT